MNERNAYDVNGFVKPIVDIVQRVITDPAAFYREMPRAGGFTDPLIFMVVMGVVAGIIKAVLGVFGIGMVGSFLMIVGSIVIVPIVTIISGFIGAGILYLIWKAMGSHEEYEIAFRCLAYAAAISPITAVLNVIPYVGPVIGLVWMTYLLVTASVEVHRIEARLAWIVFGAICAVLALASLSAQATSRKFMKGLEHMDSSMNNGLQNFDKMSPEEKGKAVGEFMKGFQKGTEK